jgi:membrane protein YqaA with SNARE-associated domain
MAEILLPLFESYGLAGLFVAAFLSYFILPIPPIEGLIVLSVNFLDPYLIFTVSFLGASLGHLVDYLIGLKGLRGYVLKKFSKTEQKARKIFVRWGPLSIVLFSWLPVVGNPLVIVAGTLKMNFWKFLLYSTLNKIWYFVLIIWFSSYLGTLF